MLWGLKVANVDVVAYMDSEKTNGVIIELRQTGDEEKLRKALEDAAST